MLYPQTNRYRQQIELSGFWEFAPDPDGVGEQSGWQNHLIEKRAVSVPASWNEQFTDLREYLGDAWYQTTFTQPWDWAEKRVMLRFGSVSYVADVWLNGDYLGKHEGGHLPFEFDVTKHIKEENNVLSVRVNGEPQPNHVPPGKVQRDPLDNFLRAPQSPDTNYDFFPFCGIHRPVVLYATSPTYIDNVTVTTDIDDSTGIAIVKTKVVGNEGSKIRYTISGHGSEVQTVGNSNELKKLIVNNASLWSHHTPNLYDLRVQLMQDDVVLDEYTLKIGIRTVAIEGDQLLLNGEPVELYGFGRHEDFHISGRGFNPQVVIHDYDLLRWIGANSFRTSHYPYAEAALDLADKLGILVISESPAVEMYFYEDGLDERMAQWRSTVMTWMQRDKNHPSIIMWSVANEPHSKRPEANAKFKEIYTLARRIDSSRPITHASYLGLDDHAMQHADVICMNRYNGWYYQVAQIENGVQVLKDELQALYDTYQRPVILTEYGADTVAGNHALPPVMFSEEFQAEMLAQYDAMLDSLPFVIGRHVWNLCDFATGQSITRINAQNLKGVFTRERQPKLAAHRLRELWSKKR